MTNRRKRKQPLILSNKLRVNKKNLLLEINLSALTNSVKVIDTECAYSSEYQHSLLHVQTIFKLH